MELELTILGQVMVFLSLSVGTILATLSPRRLHPQARPMPFGATSYVPKRGIGSADRRQPWR